MSLVTEAIPKEALDEVFPRPAIREVVFEIRFAPRLRVNADLWRIQDLVLEAYPTVGTESLLQPGSNMLTMNVFQNQATARALKVSQENFAVAFSRYSRFEDFKDEALKRTKQFCEMFEVSTILRVGLRYVNNIIIPPSERTSTILQYVRPLMDFDRVGIDAVDQFVTEVRMRKSNHLVTIRGVLLAPVEDGRRIYVLDVDCHSGTPHPANEIDSVLDTFHESAQISFLDHITEEYKNVMRGKP